MWVMLIYSAQTQNGGGRGRSLLAFVSRTTQRTLLNIYANGRLHEDDENSPNPVAAMDDGIIIAGFIEPLIKDGGPVPELLIDDDCGISRVEDV